MPSVKYIDIGLSSVEEYWNRIVTPSVRAFRATPSAISTLDAALSIWHLVDWAWHENKGKKVRRDLKRYRGHIMKACPEMAWLGDIADARKHRGLDRATTVKIAEPGLMPRSGHTVGGTGGFNEIVTLEMDDGSKEDFGRALQNAVVFWRNKLKTHNLSEP